jgi:cytochrome c-type biogenesis protein CcmF
MVLWILILVMMGAAVATFGRQLPKDLLALVLATQSLLTAAFSGFTIFTSNPFERLSPAPFEGQDLNPVLQDIGLAIHPPLLYIGYVGFSSASPSPSPR